MPSFTAATNSNACSHRRRRGVGSACQQQRRVTVRLISYNTGRRKDGPSSPTHASHRIHSSICTFLQITYLVLQPEDTCIHSIKPHPFQSGIMCLTLDTIPVKKQYGICSQLHNPIWFAQFVHLGHLCAQHSDSTVA